MRGLPGFLDVNTRPADRQPASDGGYRPRPRSRRSASRRSRSRTRSTLLTAPARSPPSITPANEYSVITKWSRSTSALPKRFRSCTCVRRKGALVPLDSVVQHEAHRGPAEHQPLRPAAGGHHLVQPEARLLAGRRGAAGRTTLIRELRMPADHQRPVSRAP